MLIDPTSCYRALSTHDARFDGRFFVGVSSTRIYCRPVCRVRTPRADRCRYFPSAAAAEVAGYRPCLRCRPELAPGYASVDATERLAQAAVELIDGGVLDDGGLEQLAARLGVTEPPRAPHLRARVRRHAGRVRADAAAAAREAPAHRHRAAGHRGRAGERLSQRAALQRVVEAALPHGADARAARSHPRAAPAGGDALRARVPAAVRLARRCSNFLGARAIAGVEAVDARALSPHARRSRIAARCTRDGSASRWRRAVRRSCSTVAPSLARVVPQVLVPRAPCVRPRLPSRRSGGCARCRSPPLRPGCACRARSTASRSRCARSSASR